MLGRGIGRGSWAVVDSSAYTHALMSQPSSPSPSRCPGVRRRTAAHPLARRAPGGGLQARRLAGAPHGTGRARDALRAADLARPAGLPCAPCAPAGQGHLRRAGDGPACPGRAAAGPGVCRAASAQAIPGAGARLAADAVEVDHALRPDDAPEDAPAQPARTALRCLARLEWPEAFDPRHAATRISLVQALPATGRRHQIRRHLKHVAHPIIGDATHGKGPLNCWWAERLGLQRLWLHAHALELAHPMTGELLRLEADWSRLGHVPDVQQWRALCALPGWQACAACRRRPGWIRQLRQARPFQAAPSAARPRRRSRPRHRP